MTRPLSRRSSAGRRSDGKRTCRVVKSGRWEGSRRWRGLEGGWAEWPTSVSVFIVVVVLGSGVGGGGISEMAFRMEVRSCRGVGREDDDDDDIFAWLVLNMRPFERLGLY